MATLEEMKLLLDKAGLKPPQEELERLKPLYEQLQERLKLMYGVNVNSQEIANVFSPEEAT